MITLEEIINSEFEHVDLDNIINILSRHNQYSGLLVAIKQINYHIENQKIEILNYGIIQVSHIASSLLIKINEYLRFLTINNFSSDKVELVYIIGNITKRLIKTTLDKIPKKVRSNQLSAIQLSLSETCQLYNYKFEELTEFIQIDDLIREIYVEYTKSKTNDILIDISIENNLPGFQISNKGKIKIDDLLALFKELNISNDIEKIKMLFKKPKNNLAIKFNENDNIYVMQFLVFLNSTEMVVSNNSKYGFYQVLECHVVNFKNVFLKGKDGRRGADRVRKLNSWEDRKTEFNSVFKRLL